MSKSPTKSVTFRFYAQLNDFLPIHKRGKPFLYYFWGNPSINNAIQAQHVPHTEVNMILVNGRRVKPDFRIKPGDRISVYPDFKLLNTDGFHQAKEPTDPQKFVVDANLGKLTKYLRMLGFDSLYDNRFEDEEIIRIATDEDRLILTRDLEMLKNSKVTQGYFLRSSQPEQQLLEVNEKFDLYRYFRAFSRCMICNGRVKSVEKSKVKDLVKEETYRIFSDFYQCNQCRQIYWKGSHYEKMEALVNSLKESKNNY